MQEDRTVPIPLPTSADVPTAVRAAYAAADGAVTGLPVPDEVMRLFKLVGRALDDTLAWTHAEQAAAAGGGRQFDLYWRWLAERARYVAVAVAGEVAIFADGTGPPATAESIGNAADWLAGMLDTYDQKAGS